MHYSRVKTKFNNNYNNNAFVAYNSYMNLNDIVNAVTSSRMTQNENLLML